MDQRVELGIIQVRRSAFWASRYASIQQGIFKYYKQKLDLIPRGIVPLSQMELKFENDVILLANSNKDIIQVKGNSIQETKKIYQLFVEGAKIQLERRQTLQAFNLAQQIQNLQSITNTQNATEANSFIEENSDKSIEQSALINEKIVPETVKNENEKIDVQIEKNELQQENVSKQVESEQLMKKQSNSTKKLISAKSQPNKMNLLPFTDNISIDQIIDSQKMTIRKNSFDSNHLSQIDESSVDNLKKQVNTFITEVESGAVLDSIEETLRIFKSKNFQKLQFFKNRKKTAFSILLLLISFSSYDLKIQILVLIICGFIVYTGQIFSNIFDGVRTFIKAVTVFPNSTNEILLRLKQIQSRNQWWIGLKEIQILNDSKYLINYQENHELVKILFDDHQNEELFQQTIYKEDQKVFVVEHNNMEIYRIFIVSINSSQNNQLEYYTSYQSPDQVHSVIQPYKSDPRNILILKNYMEEINMFDISDKNQSLYQQSIKTVDIDEIKAVSNENLSAKTEIAQIDVDLEQQESKKVDFFEKEQTKDNESKKRMSEADSLDKKLDLTDNQLVNFYDQVDKNDKKIEDLMVKANTDEVREINNEWENDLNNPVHQGYLQKINEAFKIQDKYSQLSKDIGILNVLMKEWISLTKEQNFQKHYCVIKETNLPLVRASGIIDAPIETIFEILTNRKKEYDNMFNSKKDVEVIVSKKFEVKNELYNGIFPVGKRDFVFAFKMVEYSDGSIKLGATSVEHSGCPPTSNATRGQLYFGGFQLKSVNKDGRIQTHVVYNAYNDPKGSIPKMVLQVACQKQASTIENINNIINEDKKKKKLR